MRLKMSKQPPPAATASAVGPCPTIIQIVGRPGTGRLPSTIAPPDHPHTQRNKKSCLSFSIFDIRRGTMKHVYHSPYSIYVETKKNMFILLHI